MEIVIKDIAFRYEDGPFLLEHVSMDIPAGKHICITGKSGCGKTTFLNLLVGLRKAEKGQILGIYNEKISMVFQEDRLCMDLSGATNIRIGLFRGAYSEVIENTMKTGLQINDLKKLIEEHMQLLGIETSFWHKTVSDYSGGMKRRVAIARAIMSDSELVVLDEPFKGLDAAAKQKTIQYINSYIGNRTLILVTHDIETAKALNCECVDIFDEK